MGMLFEEMRIGGLWAKNLLVRLPSTSGWPPRTGTSRRSCARSTKSLPQAGGRRHRELRARHARRTAEFAHAGHLRRLVHPGILRARGRRP